jgi:predicted ABC-type ATPase
VAIPRLAEQLLRIHQASLTNLPRAIREVDDLNVYDNTTPDGPIQLVLSARNGAITFLPSPCPEWLKRALDGTEYQIAVV